MREWRKIEKQLLVRKGENKDKGKTVSNSDGQKLEPDRFVSPGHNMINGGNVYTQGTQLPQCAAGGQVSAARLEPARARGRQIRLRISEWQIIYTG